MQETVATIMVVCALLQYGNVAYLYTGCKTHLDFQGRRLDDLGITRALKFTRLPRIHSLYIRAAYVCRKSLFPVSTREHHTSDSTRKPPECAVWFEGRNGRVKLRNEMAFALIILAIPR